MTQALEVTDALWTPLLRAYTWVHHAAHLLANHDELTGEQVRVQYQRLLDEMMAQKGDLGALSGAVDHFRKVTVSFPPVSSIAMTCPICHRPITIWNAASGQCAIMSGVPRAAEARFLASSCEVRSCADGAGQPPPTLSC